MTYKIVSRPETVIENIKKFGKEVQQCDALQERLAYARAWYAYQDDCGEWRFGPSKFVGYEHLNAGQYIRSAEQRDGRRTEAQLQKWFSTVDPSSELYGILSSALIAFLAEFDKAPSQKMRINVLSVGEKTKDSRMDSNDVLVDLLVAVAKALPSSQLAKVRARLAA